jgi:hypothetical protein
MIRIYADWNGISAWIRSACDLFCCVRSLGLLGLDSGVERHRSPIEAAFGKNLYSIAWPRFRQSHMDLFNQEKHTRDPSHGHGHNVVLTPKFGMLFKRLMVLVCGLIFSALTTSLQLCIAASNVSLHRSCKHHSVVSSTCCQAYILVLFSPQCFQSPLLLVLALGEFWLWRTWGL